MALFAISTAVHGGVLQISTDDLPQGKGDWDELVVPVKRVGNLMLIEAQVDSMYGNFVLDLGAPYLVLNKTYFRTGRLVEGAQAADATGTIAAEILRKTVSRLQIKSLYYEDLNADLADLSEIENKRGVKVLGLLGLNLFEEMELSLDTRRSVLILRRLDEAGNYLNKPAQLEEASPDLQQEFEIDNHAIVLPITVNRKKLNMIFDTGAEVSVLDNGVHKKVLEVFELKGNIILSGATGNEVEVLVGMLSSIQVNGEDFGTIQAIITELVDLENVYQSRVDGMLGYGFIAQGICRLNFPRRELTMYFYK